MFQKSTTSLECIVGRVERTVLGCERSGEEVVRTMGERDGDARGWEGERVAGVQGEKRENEL